MNSIVLPVSYLPVYSGIVLVPRIGTTVSFSGTVLLVLPYQNTVEHAIVDYVRKYVLLVVVVVLIISPILGNLAPKRVRVVES